MPSPPITASLIAEDPMRRTLLVAWGGGVPAVVTPVQGHLNRLHRSRVRAARLCGPAGRAPVVPGPGQRGRAGRLGLVPVIHVIHGVLLLGIWPGALAHLQVDRPAYDRAD